MEYADIQGLRIAYRRQGQGETLVLLHGGLADGRSWRRQLGAFADEYDVVAWDAPGCGGSDDPPATFTMADYADHLAAFVRALDLQRPHVLGLSFGGGLALALYERHPEIPRTLLLVSAYAGWGGSLAPEETARRLRSFRQAAEMPVDDWAPDFVASLLSPAAPAGAAEEVLAVVRDYHPRGARVMAEAFAAADLRHVLPRIEVPTLLLYGDADVRSPPAVADALQVEIPGATRVTLDGVGHLLNVEAPERFEREVRTFLRVHRA